MGRYEDKKKNTNVIREALTLCHFDFNYIQFIDQFLIDAHKRD